MQNTVFDFESKIFKVQGGHFVRSIYDGSVLFRCDLGDVMAGLEVNSVKREFRIADDSADGQLLTTLPKALEYVPAIYPGDTIPSEILDGTASWKFEKAHFERANARLSMQLAAWVMGKDAPEFDIRQFQKQLEIPAVRYNVQEGLSRAAVELSYGADGKERVVGNIEKLAGELAYIEALQDFYESLFRMQRDLQEIKVLFANDRVIRENHTRVVQLIRGPIQRYQDLFTNCNVQVGEVVQAIKNLPNVIEFVRKTRDQLRRDTLLWGEVFAVWDDVNKDQRAAVSREIAGLYRFLAQHFPLVDVWM